MKFKIEPKNIESRFENDEMFFSITDLKGRIISGNNIFVRTSKYSLDEMVGQPHNIVRHPDMPKAVFKLFWEYIQSGKPIVAYVKNMAKDGSYYWVLATAFPVFDDEGNIVRYLSIRIKPESKLFETVKELYKELRKIEHIEGMEKSYRVLFEKLEELGFDSYDSFMRKVLEEELKLKEGVLETHISKSDKWSSSDESIYEIFLEFKRIQEIYSNIYAFLNEFLKIGSILQEKSKDIFSLSGDIRLISLNSSVESYKLGVHGNSFFVLSTEMRKTAEESGKTVIEMERIIDKSVKVIDNVTFYMSLSKLGIYMFLEFLEEILEKNSDNFFRREDLIDNHSIIEQNINNLIKGSTDLDKKFKNLISLLSKVKILIKRLHFLYLSGMVESAHQTQTSFSIIFSQVNELVENTKSTIDKLNCELQSIYENNKYIKEQMNEIIDIIEKTKENISKLNSQLTMS